MLCIATRLLTKPQSSSDQEWYGDTANIYILQKYSVSAVKPLLTVLLLHVEKYQIFSTTTYTAKSADFAHFGNFLLELNG